MIKHYLYIGSNNTTHELEKEKIISEVSRFFNGFTAYEVIGYWKGKEEKTLKIEVVSDGAGDTAIIRLCKELAVVLDQDAILLETVESNVAFINK